MPVLGFVAGAWFASPFGDLAGVLAAAVLAVIGLWLVFESRDEFEQARRLAYARGPALLVLGAAIGLDELGIGAGAGLLRQSPFLVLGLIALEAVIATPLGLAVGSRTRRLSPLLFERFAGIVLVVLALTIAIGGLRSGHF
jgi:putative Mn2+ efflux pump MntP